jgi:hypothetical protein
MDELVKASFQLLGIVTALGFSVTIIYVVASVVLGRWRGDE